MMLCPQVENSQNKSKQQQQQVPPVTGGGDHQAAMDNIKVCSCCGCLQKVITIIKEG